MKIQTRKTIQSKALEGVSFTLRRIGSLKQAEFEYQTLDHQFRIAELFRKYRAIKADQEGSEAEGNQISLEVELIMARHLGPSAIRFQLIALHGLSVEIDGVETAITTADELLNLEAPELDPLIREIGDACGKASQPEPPAEALPVAA